jgi:hypothetical protein
MARFLIEVTHDEDTIACAKAVEAFLRTGSHFLTHADWGCMDGDHRAWMIVELDTKDEALNVVPPVFHSRTRIIGLTSFTLEQIREIQRRYGVQT